MKGENLRHEDYALSCKFLAEKAWNIENIDIRALVLDDLATKNYFFFRESPENANHRTRLQSINAGKTRKSADVAIFTVTDRELPALKLAFGIDQNKIETENINGIRIWDAVIKPPSMGTELRLELVFLGEQTNIASAVECSRVFDVYDVGLAMLVGVAAGVKTKVRLMDVVSAVDVIYYEHQALKETGATRRPIPFESSPEMRGNLSSFILLPGSWETMIKGLKLNWSSIYQEKWLEHKKYPDFHKAIILSGEKMIKNGKLPEFAEEYHDKAFACDEESAGFCKSCLERQIPWIVFRGISDFGDPKKKKKHQPQAALLAATSAVSFLMTEYRQPSKVVKF